MFAGMWDWSQTCIVELLLIEYRLAASIVLDMTYGYQVTKGQDNLVELIEHAMDQYTKDAQPGAHLVDLIPWSAFWSYASSFSLT